MTTLAALLLPVALTTANVNVEDVATHTDAPMPIEFVAVLYPPDDPEGPDDEGTGEGEGSGGSTGGTSE